MPTSLRRPPDAHVHVVALGEQPPVAADDATELDHGRAAISATGQQLIGQSSFDCHPVPALHTDRACRDAVRPVGPDHDRGTHKPLTKSHAGVRRVDGRCPCAIGQLGSGGNGLLHEERVKPDALRHEDQGRPATALEAARVTQPHDEPVDLLLDDRRGREGKRAHGARRESAAAGLVARKARAICEKHRSSRAGQVVSRQRPGRPCPDDDDVVPTHPFEPTLAQSPNASDGRGPSPRWPAPILVALIARSGAPSGAQATWIGALALDEDKADDRSSLEHIF